MAAVTLYVGEDIIQVDVVPVDVTALVASGSVQSISRCGHSTSGCGGK